MAVVGAGPGGLAVAYDLVQIGYRVTIYEREQVPGGLLTTSVPLYRLDREVVMQEIEDLAEMGIEFRYGVDVGQDITLQELRDAHDAVVVAVGYSGGRILPLPGSDAQGVWSALDFLYQYTMGKDPKVGTGGLSSSAGATWAADCSRSALRCGADEVHAGGHRGPGRDARARPSRWKAPWTKGWTSSTPGALKRCWWRTARWSA